MRNRRTILFIFFFTNTDPILRHTFLCGTVFFLWIDSITFTPRVNARSVCFSTVRDNPLPVSVKSSIHYERKKKKKRRPRLWFTTANKTGHIGFAYKQSVLVQVHRFIVLCVLFFYKRESKKSKKIFVRKSKHAYVSPTERVTRTVNGRGRTENDTIGLFVPRRVTTPKFTKRSVGAHTFFFNKHCTSHKTSSAYYFINILLYSHFTILRKIFSKRRI